MSSEDQQVLRLRLVYFMRRLFFASIFLILLTGCESKKDICSKHEAGQAGYGYYDALKKLGLKEPSFNSGNAVRNYCEYFKK